MRPRRIEVHVDGERAGEPYAHCRQKRPFFIDVLPGEREGKHEPKKSVNGSAQRHRQDIGKGKAVCRDAPAEKIECENKEVGQEKKRKPKNGGTDRKEITHIAGFSVFLRQELTIGARAGLGKVQITVPPVLFEVQIMLNERCAYIGVVAYAVSMDDGVEHWQGNNETQKEDSPKSPMETRHFRGHGDGARRKIGHGIRQRITNEFYRNESLMSLGKLYVPVKSRVRR